jgi:hypothetical protein
VHAKGGDDIEKKTENKTKEKNRGENPKKKKPRTKGGETEKRGRKRAFFSRCLHCYLRFRLRLHQVKSSSSL